ncbi:MAG: hypothetical protein K9K66_10715 [Desulfarculaceae bacterium]|nr:hypothetical protein [Desulfarculaceae bacterium]MCF8102121.1 hypothetical protein [Desulfarculaceae bacterium]MCF8118334.1 hypothetical protein [Desulfarculaceae bacterium]
MEKSIAIITVMISGLFTLTSGVLLWRMKVKRDEFSRKIAIEEKNRAEKKQLYLDIQTSFENTMGQVLAGVEVSNLEFAYEINARVRLFAPDQISRLYMGSCELLEQWSALHRLSQPRQIDLAGKKVTLIQAPDPTAKYKEPAKDAFDKLQKKLTELIEVMKDDIG